MSAEPNTKRAPSGRGKLVTVHGIEWNPDLLTFTELNDGIKRLEGSALYTDSIPAGTRRRYYRAGKN